MSSRNFDDLLFVGTYGHVLAIEKKNGKTAWTTSLPRTGWSMVSIVYEDDTLFCASGGKVFALDPKNGEILWKNKMPSMSGPVYLTTVASSGDAQRQVSLMNAPGTEVGGNATPMG